MATKFVVGQTVEATCGYAHQITQGKRYVVTGVSEEYYEASAAFTWPEYVTVVGDFGEPVTGHTYRFKAIEDVEVNSCNQLQKL